MKFNPVFLSAVLIFAACSGRSQQAETTASPSVAPAAAATTTAATTTAATVTAATTTAAPVAAAPVTAGVGAPAQTTVAPSANPYAGVAFTDIKGIYAETAIKQEAALGIFGSKTGAFHPFAPILRADYVRWLVLANNAYFSSPGASIRLAEADSDQTFVDVPRSDPNFRYIQGMANAGYVVGIDSKHFAPSRNLTREEMLAILINRDLNGKVSPASLSQVQADTGLADANQISKPYWGPIDADHWSNIFGSSQSLNRVFGPIKYLHPKKPSTRAEVAVAIQLIQNHSAEQALKNGGPY